VKTQLVVRDSTGLARDPAAPVRFDHAQPAAETVLMER